MEVGRENWLIPVDAELKSDRDAEHEAISLKNLMMSVSTASKLGLVILDACRNNPFTAKMQRTARVRAVTRGFTAVEAKRERPRLTCIFPTRPIPPTRDLKVRPQPIA